MTFDTSKIDEWSLDMCRDWLAEIRGFAIKIPESRGFVAERPQPFDEKLGSFAFDHPIPATLDEASKLPEGWAISEIKPYNHMMYAGAVKSGAFPSAPRTYAHAYGTNELHARFILRCKVESRPH